MVLVGSPGYGYKNITALIKKNSYLKDVIQPGWIGTEELPYIINAATAFVFPSFYEGFGMPILEAMACGTPVITSNFGATKEVASDAALLVDPHNPDNISQAMNNLTIDSKLRKKLIARSFIRIKDFSWHETTKKIMRLFREI